MASEITAGVLVDVFMFLMRWHCGDGIVEMSQDVSHLIDAESFMAIAVILQHEVRSPLGRGIVVSSRHAY